MKDICFQCGKHLKQFHKKISSTFLTIYPILFFITFYETTYYISKIWGFETFDFGPNCFESYNQQSYSKIRANLLDTDIAITTIRPLKICSNFPLDSTCCLKAKTTLKKILLLEIIRGLVFQIIVQIFAKWWWGKRKNIII